MISVITKSKQALFSPSHGGVSWGISMSALFSQRLLSISVINSLVKYQLLER
jgi:hypothetical protein